MKRNRLLGGLAAVAISVLAADGVLAQTTAGTDPALAARQQELAGITADRGRVIQEIMDQWRSQLKPAIPSQNVGDGEAQITSALRSATPELLLAASRAQNSEELMAVLSSRQGPSVIPLGPGPIPSTLGSTSGDLVFTAVTPCRIIDTRLATGGFAGRIAANTGKQFSVNLVDFTAQGGSATACGMPTAFDVSGVAINVTSTDQTGLGNIAVIECGGGVPTVSLLNYAPGVNGANAAAVSSAIGCSLGGDIYIRSNNSASHVIVDIMGYYAAPVATAIQNTRVETTVACAAGASCSLTATCPAGYGLTGGGASVLAFTAGFDIIWDSPSTGDATPNAWLCQAQNNSGASRTLACSAICARVPGR